METCKGFERECSGKPVSLGYCSACYARMKYREKHPKSGQRVAVPRRKKAAVAPSDPEPVLEQVLGPDDPSATEGDAALSEESEMYFWVTPTQMQRLLQALLRTL